MADFRHTTPLVPILVAGAVAVVGLGGYFTLAADDAPEADTNPASSEEVAQRPTGAGTKPEGEADTTIDGVTAELDEVEPAAPGEESIPAQEQIEERGEGDGPADTFIADEGMQTAQDGDGAADSFLLEDQEDTAGAGDDRTTADTSGSDDSVTPEPDQDVVDDPDNTTQPFVPTPSGPEGRDDDALTSE
ncbi:hypothetical protein SAMN04490244_109187 [Tranquillimonas rosea]|uniref:Uncharacterized protein n=1 Tax=Tranquillimonas rosea TaxID=641238 RepID=A0A1H9W8M0_9RHOB|nr:hypothetical protein [Tranquillimonas rosea]SES30017.1 hypothetical protein SAMN04490244_109187 [Tranquillimonas rosea]